MFRRSACLLAIASATVTLLTACDSGADVAPTKDRLLAKADLPKGLQLSYPSLAQYRQQNNTQLSSVSTDPEQCVGLIKSVFAGNNKGVVLGAVGSDGQIVETLSDPVPNRVANLKKLTQQCATVVTKAQGQSATAHYATFDTSGVTDGSEVYGLKVTNEIAGQRVVAVLIVAERNGVGLTLNASSQDERKPDRVALVNKALSKLDS